MIVWGITYQPRGDSYPNLRVIGGSKDGAKVVDDTPDGGAKLKSSSQHEAGRRVRRESLPTIIRWMGNRKLQDYEGAYTCKSVSTRFRDLIEEIEPSIHQFEPIKYVKKSGELIEDRWCWIICHRIDGADRNRTNLKLEFGPTGIGVWCPTGVLGAHVTFYSKAIGNAKFWWDKHFVGAAPYVSNDAKQRIEAANITGVSFFQFEQPILRG